jgi:hypothetical protein
VKEDGNGTTLSIGKKRAGDFGAYVAKALPDLYDAFTREKQAANSVRTPSV